MPIRHIALGPVDLTVDHTDHPNNPYAFTMTGFALQNASTEAEALHRYRA